MSHFVEIVLDKPRQFRLRAIEAANICDSIGRLPGRKPIGTSELLGLLGTLDYVAWAHVLTEGCKHEDPTLRPERTLRLLSDALEADTTLMMPLSDAVIKAGQLTGVFQVSETAREAAAEADARGKGRGSSASEP